MHKFSTTRIGSAKWPLALTLLAALVACGGGGNDTPAPVKVAAANLQVPVTATTVAAMLPATGAAVQPVTFSNGFTGVNPITNAPVAMSGATTVAFTAPATPSGATGFKIDNGGYTATGPTTYGSCVFTVTASTFPAGSPLANGQVFVVDPCAVTVSTGGGVANGVAVIRNVLLTLGGVTSTSIPLSVVINTDGSVSVGNASLGTVTVSVVTGAGG